MLNCTEWDTKDDCFLLSKNAKVDLSSGDSGQAVPGPKYFVTMRMLQLERPFLFNGSKLSSIGVYNVNFCKPGFGGDFCQKCSPGSFSSDYGTKSCKTCPCEVDESEHQTDFSSVQGCRCKPHASKNVNLSEVFLICIGFNFVLFLSYYFFYRSSLKQSDGSEQ